MKKNVMMRIASIMLVLVLMTSSVISGTFAKYVSYDNGSDNARVAKWGVEIEANSYNMFTDKYKLDDTAALSFVGDYSVDSNNDDDVLAPGTSGSFADISIKGTPEVAVDVTIGATVTISDNWKVNDVYYCPIVVTVGDAQILGMNYNNATDFAAAIEQAIEGKSAKYAPNTDLAGIYNNTNLDLGWSWAFSTGEVNDIQDTALGNKAVTEDLTIAISLEITVTQIN